MAKFTEQELIEANEKCEQLFKIIFSIPKDDETYDLLDSAFQRIWDAKRSIEKRLPLEYIRRKIPDSQPRSERGNWPEVF
jgi:hypothetical protein